jgi:hypothetical protein
MADDPAQVLSGQDGSTERMSSPASGNESATVSVRQPVSAGAKSFTGREEPALASPSGTDTAEASQEQRFSQALSRIERVEAEIVAAKARLQELARTVIAEQRRGRSARVGHYLLWAAVIAVMTAFWLLLRLHPGLS